MRIIKSKNIDFSKYFDLMEKLIFNNKKKCPIPWTLTLLHHTANSDFLVWKITPHFLMDNLILLFLLLHNIDPRKTKSNANVVYPETGY